MARFQDIALFPRAYTEFDVGLDQLLSHLERWKVSHGLDLDPDFQRGHVWSEAQKIAYIEFVLRGGEVGKTIIVNAPEYASHLPHANAQIVDGKQRLAALVGFLKDEFPVFGAFYSEYTDKPRMFTQIHWRVVSLDRKGILNLYLSLNSGGTPHTTEELEKVRTLLREAE